MYPNASKILFAGILILLAPRLGAQIQKLENVLTATLNGAGPIISDAVNGYYALYEIDEKSRGKSEFQLSVFDQNLSPLSSKKFIMNTGSSALEAAFNGECLMFKFKNSQEEKYTYKIFDKNARLVRSSSKPAYFLDYMDGSSEQSENLRLFPVSGRGFIDYSIKNKKGKMSETRYVINFFPHDSTAVSWQASSPVNSEYYESADFLGVSGNTLLSLVTKREGMMDKDLKEYILGTNLKTGKKLFERQLEDDEYVVSTLSVAADEDNNTFTVIGLYFDADAQSFKDKSLGLFAFSLDTNGQVTRRKYVSWEKDVAKFLPVSEKGKIKDVGYLYFHRFLKTAGGHYFGIGEEYHRAASAMGIAASILSPGGASVVKAVTGDLYVFEFDRDFNLSSVTKYDKAKSNVSLPAGSGMLSARTVGLYLKNYGGFDYQFSQMSRDKTEFNSGYLDYDKSKGARHWQFGSINYGDGRLSGDKLKLDSEADWFRVFPGKPGYVMVTEYYRKEKRMEFRMEKLNY